MKTYINIFGRHVEVDVLDSKGMKIVTLSGYVDSCGKLVKTGKFTPVRFVRNF